MRVPVDIGVIDWNLRVIGGAGLLGVLREQSGLLRLVIYGDATGDVPRQAPGAGNCVLLCLSLFGWWLNCAVYIGEHKIS